MYLNGREVVDVEVDGVDPTDFPDFSDAYFSKAVYKDTGQELSNEELEKLEHDYRHKIWDMAFLSYVNHEK